jgi:hypothetical protein
MEPTLPFWFKQRQCKAEAAGERTLRVTGPNLAEAFLRIEPVGDRWRAALRLTADGPDVSSSEDIPTADEAWQAAFELYRVRMIV